MSPSTATTEWRVGYRRVGWQRTQFKTFSTRAIAERFMLKLRAPTDLASINLLQISTRHVSPWTLASDIPIQHRQMR